MTRAGRPFAMLFGTVFAVVMVTMSVASLVTVPAAASGPASSRASVVAAGEQDHHGCDVTITAENNAGNAIQSAIDNAHRGARICIGPGTFAESLVISTPIHLVGVRGGDHGNARSFDHPEAKPSAILEPTSLPAATTDLDTGLLTHAIILVTASGSGTSIRNLGINGSQLAPALASFGCDNFFGVYFRDAGGSLLGNSITNIALGTSLDGCQGQNAVFVNNGFFTSGIAAPIQVSIGANHVAGYGKNGITCNDPGVSCTISGNAVTGLGPVDFIAQNGIQVGFGATGSVAGNLVTGNSYSAACDTENYTTACYMAGGILLYDSSAPVLNNRVIGNDIGIGIADYSTWTASGFAPSNLAPVLVRGNTVIDSYGYGIVFDGDNGTAVGNTIRDAPVGILANNFGAPYSSYNITVIVAHDHFDDGVSLETQALSTPPYYAVIIFHGQHHHHGHRDDILR